MADQREIHLQEQAAKKRRDKVKKTFTTFILVLLAGIMVVSLTPGKSGNVGRISKGLKIAAVKGRTYNYINGSAFYYLMSRMQSGISDQYSKTLDSDQIRRISVLQSANSLQSLALYNSLAKDIGLHPSKLWMAISARNFNSSINLQTIPGGMVELLEMQYAQSSLSPRGGDMTSVISLVTTGELFSYFDLVNYSVVAEFVYLDVTNYIKNRVKQKDLKEFYNQDPATYAESVRVESIAVNLKKLSSEVMKVVSTSGWKEALKLYVDKKTDNVSYVPEQEINNDKDSIKRYKAALKNSSNNIVLKPVYENKTYHIIHILGYNSYSKLSDYAKESVRADYMALNFDKLRQAYQTDIQDAVVKLEKTVKSSHSLSTGSRVTGFTYFRSFNISPINQLLRDNKKNKVDLPLMHNKQWMDFLFTSEPGTISKTYYNDAYVVKMKVIKRGRNKDIAYDQIDQEIYKRYVNFKNTSIAKDWNESLQTRYDFQIQEENLKELF